MSKKYSRKIRKCAKEMINASALVSKDTFDEVVADKSGMITRLHMQLDKAIEEADEKVTENINLTKELGQAKQDLISAEAENSKIRKFNESLTKEMNKVMDDSMALRDELRFNEENSIEREKYIMKLESRIREKDDLIKQLQRPWYRKIFG